MIRRGVWTPNQVDNNASLEELTLVFLSMQFPFGFSKYRTSNGTKQRFEILKPMPTLRY